MSATTSIHRWRNKTFGQLKVLRLAERIGQHWYWLCRCKCGTELKVRECYLLSDHTTSCGCVRAKACGNNFRRHGESHGTPEYEAWCGMRKRCYNPNAKQFADYGGRGIRVCRRWRSSYENFLADMGRKPTPQHSLERKRNDGHYTPTNCHWATPLEQGANKRNNRLFTYAGKTQHLAAWAREAGLDVPTLRRRLLDLGWPIERAITEPLEAPKHYLTYRGKTRTLKEWAAITPCLTYKTIYARKRKGLSPKEILNSDPRKKGRRKSP